MDVRAQRSANVFLNNRDAAADAKGERRGLEAGGGLLALVFVEVDFAHDVVDDGLFVALLDDLGAGEAFFHVEAEDAVEHGVGGQGVFVFLIGA